MRKETAYGIGILGLLFAAIGFLFIYLEYSKVGMTLFFLGWALGFVGLIMDRVIKLKEREEKGLE